MENNRPIRYLEDLEKHLNVLTESPQTTLNAELFDDVELQLTDINIPPLIPRLLPKLVEVLTIYEHDPSPIVSLAIKLLKPVTFTQAFSLASSETLTLALQSPAPSTIILAMTVIEKAAGAPSDTAILSNMRSVVSAFIVAWLSSPSVEVGEKATRVLGDLLDVDCDPVSTAMMNTTLTDRVIPIARQHAGYGLLWRRIFDDQEIYSSIYYLTCLSDVEASPFSLDERQKSLAQARLLRILPRLCLLDFKALMQSEYPAVGPIYDVNWTYYGLLPYAAIGMVNRHDPLMFITLMDFFREFLDLLSMTVISPPTLWMLKDLVREAVHKYEALGETLKELKESPSTPVEMVELLQQLLSTAS